MVVVVLAAVLEEALVVVAVVAAKSVNGYSSGEVPGHDLQAKWHRSGLIGDIFWWFF